MSKVELREVSKAFRYKRQKVNALEKINLIAPRGDFVTIIGPSGCGKSTLFNIVCGLIEPDQGEILIDGQLAPRRVGTMGYMPQKDLLLPWRNVLDNVIVGPEIAGADRAASRREAQELLPLFGLEGFEHHLPATLSGGMKQRAALLRTFLCHREIMLLDEPFGALDALTRIALQDWLLNVWRHLQHTILFITHDVDEAIYLSDSVNVMSTRPGHIKLTLPITLPRPRARNMTNTAKFIELKNELLNALDAG